MFIAHAFKINGFVNNWRKGFIFDYDGGQQVYTITAAG